MNSENEIVKKIELGNSLEEEKRYDDALHTYLSIWNEDIALKKDKYTISETRWLISCIYMLYIKKKDYKNARQWAEEVFKCKIPYRGTSELISLGVIYLELGLKNEAMEQFDKAYQKGKIRAFQGFDNKYLQFYLSNKK